MPKVLSHTPAWLSRPSTGFQVFQPTAETKPRSQAGVSNALVRKDDQAKVNRLIAHRGSEIFFVVGNELRWSDLIWLRDADEDENNLRESSRRGGSSEKDSAESLRESVSRCSRTLKVPVAGQIRQLVISPLGDYLAIVTSHTVHVAVLPARLDSSPTGSVKVKTFQLGPTAHVLEQAPIASVLWHPLGTLGSCLVTVTADACVRLWELNTESRHSFDEPTLALDLKKLANATSANEDLRASAYGTSKGFSPDSVEMEVSAAAYGGIGTSDEQGWSPMTLWIAMREGDVYALCPLLPSKWQPASTTISSLSTAVVSKAAILESDANASDSERRTVNQQQKWLAEIDAQDPIFASVPSSLRTVEVYRRPQHPAAIPKLQGPFRINPEPDFDEVTDIVVMAPKIDEEDEFDLDEDEVRDGSSKPGVSIGIICLATQSGSVHVCLDVNGVEAQWLPSKRATFQRPIEVEDDSLDLLLLDTVQPEQGSTEETQACPVITPNISHRYLLDQPIYEQDATGRYGFFVTVGSGVFACDLTPWLNGLEDELTGPTSTGAALRVGLLYEADKTKVERVITFSDENASPSGCMSLLDTDLDHIVLAPSNNQPLAAILETPAISSYYDNFAPDNAPLALPTPELWEAYQPPQTFYSSSTLPQFLDSLMQSGNTRLRREDMKQQVRLSPATLQIMTEAHRVVSDESSRLGLAAADLFRRCQRMQRELAGQIAKVREIADRVDALTGHDDNEATDETEGNVVGGNQRIEGRIERARDRSAELQRRVDHLRKHMANVGSKELSKKEEAWGQEVDSLNQTLTGGGDGKQAGLDKRFDAVNKLSKDLIAQAKDAEAKNQRENGQPEEASANEQEAGSRPTSKSSANVPSDFRKQKLAQVMQLLDRESALVEAVQQRLARLGA